MKVKFILLVCFLVLLACKEEAVIPKPRAMLRLEYAKPERSTVETDYFAFENNTRARVKSTNKGAVELKYPELKASIFISYRKVKNDLQPLILDAQKLSYEHAAKSDGIRPRAYDDGVNSVYGTFFEVSGDAASQAQFYVTDSLNHFVTGSLYFETKPNYDSIYPAAVYLQNDMGRIIETLRWK